MKRKNSFDRKHYKEIKQFVYSQISAKPGYISPQVLDVYLFMIQDCVHREDYEGAQATKDAIIEYFNTAGLEIPNDARLNLPEYKPMQVKCHLSFAKGKYF